MISTQTQNLLPKLKVLSSNPPTNIDGVPILPLPLNYTKAYADTGWIYIKPITEEFIAYLPNFDPIYKSYRDETDGIFFTIKFFEYIETNYNPQSNEIFNVIKDRKAIYAIQVWRELNGWFDQNVMQCEMYSQEVSKTIFYHLEKIYSRFNKVSSAKLILEGKIKAIKERHIEKSRKTYYELKTGNTTEKKYLTEEEIKRFYLGKDKLIEESIDKMFTHVYFRALLMNTIGVRNNVYLNGEYVLNYDVDAFNPSYANLTAKGNEARKISKDIRILAFLDVIARAEGTDFNPEDGISQGYSSHGGSTIKPDFKNFNEHPGASAAGRYQAIPSTWKMKKSALGLTDFTPAAQEIFGVAMLLDKNIVVDIRQIDDDVTNNKFEDAVDKASKTWASFPNRALTTDPEYPKSYYKYSRGENKGKPQPAKKVKDLKKWYKQAFDAHKKGK